MKKSHFSIFLIFLSITIPMTAAGNSLTELSESYLKKKIQKDSYGRIELISFENSGETSRKVSGIEVRQLTFDAQINFLENVALKRSKASGDYNTFETSTPRSNTNTAYNYMNKMMSRNVDKGSLGKFSGVFLFVRENNKWKTTDLTIDRIIVTASKMTGATDSISGSKSKIDDEAHRNVITEEVATYNEAVIKGIKRIDICYWPKHSPEIRGVKLKDNINKVMEEYEIPSSAKWAHYPNQVQPFASYKTPDNKELMSLTTTKAGLITAIRLIQKCGNCNLTQIKAALVNKYGEPGKAFEKALYWHGTKKGDYRLDMQLDRKQENIILNLSPFCERKEIDIDNNRSPSTNKSHEVTF